MCKHDFSKNTRYNRLFQKSVHKLGESEINYINIFYNYKALEISVVNLYSENQLMHTFLDNFRQEKNSPKIAIQQEELRGEEIMVDQKSLSVDAFKLIT